MYRIACLLYLLVVAMAAACLATPTENQQISILPARGKVTIDGRFDEWDLARANRGGQCEIRHPLRWVVDSAPEVCSSLPFHVTSANCNPCQMM